MSAKRKLGAMPIKVSEIRSTPEPDVVDDHYQGRNGELRLGEGSPSDDVGIWPYHSSLGGKKPTPPTPRDIPSPATLQETGSVHDETSSSGNKEDDDDEEEEIDDLKTMPHDPERLKAFNMFVRLFVDENLDRIVPISKQPKEKIQAIIDSCTRQFPEFAERARKRIRTYLKSCRRNKRTRDSNWPESNRPTPAHLTSVQAEQILAQACENESHNAKRMRLGLEPVSQPPPVIPGSETPPSRPAHESFSAANLASSAANQSESKLSHQHQHPIHLNNNKPDSPNLAKVSEPTPAPAISSISSSPLNGAATSTAPSALFRPNFGPAFQRGAGPQHFPGTPLFPTPPFGAPGMMHNGPTDLSMKPSKPLLSHKLSPQEMAAVRQLITGYRESAAFLLRSAEELEQLLLQQP
ncbi:nucleolar protein 4-like isoform X2 [Macrosteles quadrilineatus]|uniref:nucleolar protein 4-like isoform X2 n=1 Tax=Macrosteles quadrilineatus TaxID=74068 RepID=UPI0023E24D67|nr:nucleolar protein 4-like isoform X2 [Macrosteles quadrilineatus]